MTVEEFNALVSEAYDASFSYEQKLIGVYLSAYTRQGNLAVTRFKTQTEPITAAAWTPPAYESLVDGMNEKEVKDADRVRDEAAAAILAVFASIGLAAFGVEFMQAISERAQLNFEQELLRNLRKIVSDGFANGLSSEETAVLIRDKFAHVTPASAEMLAQTELTTLVNQKSLEAAQKQFPNGILKTWLSMNDAKVRPAHAQVSGTSVPQDQPFQVGGSSMMYPGDPSAPLRLTARCFPADTLVAGSVNAAMKSYFEGRMVRVRTGTGRELSGTENHPILTLSGWKTLGEVNEGDHLVRAGFNERSVPGAFDIENVPARIKEVFDSLLGVGGSERIAAIDVDLYGDTLTGDVEVVWADGLLELPGTPSGFKPTEKFAFADSDITESFLSVDSSEPLLVGGSLPTPSSSLGSERDETPLLVGQLAHAQKHGFGLTPTLDPSFVESSLDRLPTHTEACGDLQFGESFIDVEPNDLVNVQGNTITAPGDIGFAEMEEDGLVTDAKLIRDLSSRQAAFVETDNVVSVESYPFQGDVFTLSTEQGYYIANGFCVKNCRCRLSFTNDPAPVVASAQEDTLVTMQTTEPFTTTTNTANSFATITIDTESETEMACPDCGAMNDMAAQVCDQCGADMESPAEDAAEPGEETPMVDGPAWRALLAVEGVPTEDGRMLAEGSLTWRDLPLSLMAMDETTEGGHLGAKVAGRIDNIWRVGNEVWGEGVFNGNDFGLHIADLVANQSLRGNSIDPAVTAAEYRNADTGEVLDDNALMDAVMNGDPVLTVFLSAIIMASTVCPTPAIGEANIMLASGIMRIKWFQEQTVADAITASAAGLAPVHPPAAWFQDPGFRELTPLTVTDDGRVMGHAAGWNTCHIGEPSGPGVCVTPPRSGMNYEVFHHGAVETAEGHDVSVGHITMSTHHASSSLGWKAAQDHYDHSGCVVADVRAGEDQYGIWVSGALRPDLSVEKVREMKAGSISGDWRSVIGRGLEFISALIVNIPGFPIPRASASITASASGGDEIESLVAAGIVECDCVDDMSRREYLRKIRALTN